MTTQGAGAKKPTEWMKSKPKTKTIVPPSFWVTPPGRNLVGGLACATASLYFGGYTFLHSWCLGKYRDAVQLYRNGFATPLTPDVIVRCHETVKDVKYKLKSPDLVNFFCVYGMDLFHAGSTNTRQGSIVGVPSNFSYRTVKDVDKDYIMVENKNVEWGSEGGQLLQDALVFSENAQKFGIAREIAMTHTHAPYIHGGIGTSAVFTYYTITKVINDKLLGLNRPKSFRVLVYSLVGTFAVGMWVTATDLLTKYYEKWADKEAGSVNLNYAKGGVEFYAKILQRNMALRSLMGPSGEKMFTYYGNDVEFIRQQHIPYTDRKKTLETIAEQLSMDASQRTEEQEQTEI